MRHILLTWNPGPEDDELWTPEEWREDMVDRIEAGKMLKGRWSVGRRRHDIEPGDRAYLLRQGDHGRGIVAIGEIDSDIYQEPAADEEDEVINFVDVLWFDALPIDKRLSVENLERVVPSFPWTKVYQSGREISGDAAVEMDAMLERAKRRAQDST